MMLLSSLTLIVALAQAAHPGANGQAVMGFDQDKTAHHFYLYEDGGAIEVAIKTAGDTTNLDAIRAHLPHIAMMFGQGNFEAPVLVHDTKNVPGIAELAHAKDKIAYKYVETAKGGRVDIVTADKQTLSALHQFLQYQIAEHKTGDPATVAKRK